MSCRMDGGPYCSSGARPCACDKEATEENRKDLEMTTGQIRTVSQRLRDGKLVEQNMFHDARDVGTLLRLAVGAASVCWEKPEGAGVFDSDRALLVAKDAQTRLEQLHSELPDLFKG